MRNGIVAVFGLLTALIATCCAGTAANVADRRSELEKTERGRAIPIGVMCRGSDGALVTHIASGVLIAPNRALTAFHVIDCPEAFPVVVIDGTAIPAQVDATEPLADLARLTFPRGGKPWGTSVAVVTKGDRICVASAAPAPDYQCGKVREFRDTLDGDVEHTAVVRPGNSGSGVYDSRGRLVGITTHYKTCGGDDKNYCAGRMTALYGHKWMVP
jgi:S1-C subfamily serine protease